MIHFQPLCRHHSVCQSSPLGQRRRNILGERKRARECLTDQAERMVKRSCIELQAGNVGLCQFLWWTEAVGPSQHPRCHHRQEWKRPLGSTPLPHDKASCVKSTLQLLVVNSCWRRTVTLTGTHMFHFVKPWNVQHLADKDLSNVILRFRLTPKSVTLDDLEQRILGLPKVWPAIISRTGKATNYKFGWYIHRVHPNKNPLKCCRKGSVGVTRDCPKFSSTLYYLRNGLSYGLQIWPVYWQGPSEQKPIKNSGGKGALA